MPPRARSTNVASPVRSSGATELSTNDDQLPGPSRRACIKSNARLPSILIVRNDSSKLPLLATRWADGLAMVEGVLQVSEMQARDIMVPRAQMDVIDVSEPPDRFIPFAEQTGAIKAITRWVLGLPDFSDDPQRAGEKVLEAIQAAWIEELD